MFIFAVDMKVVTHIENALYSFRWAESTDNVLDEMAVKYTDVLHLQNYFEGRPEGLRYYKESVEKAVAKTVRESSAIIEELYDLAERSNNDEEPDLDELFTPLHREAAYNHPRYYTDYKANGEEAPWVRLYAVKIDTNMHVLTGYAIKLVPKMQDDPLLIKELEKLDQATEYLKSEGYL